MAGVKISLFCVIVYNIYNILATQYLLSILLITERSRRSGSLRALAEARNNGFTLTSQHRR